MRGAIRLLMASQPLPAALLGSAAAWSQAVPGSASAWTGMSVSITPAVGDLLVVKGSSWGSAITFSTPTGGPTWTSRSNTGVVTNSGPAQIWTGVATTATAQTITVPLSNGNTGTGMAAMCVERWSGTLAATPNQHAVAVTAATTPAEDNVTAGTIGAAITWVGSDYSGIAPAAGGPTYYGGAVSTNPNNPSYYNSANNFSAYFAYQMVTAVGAQTYGLTAPTGQRTSFASLEIIPR